MRSLVIDTSALLALVFAEKGAEEVSAALVRSQAVLLSTVSYSEAMAKAIDRQVPFEAARALTAASFRQATRSFEFSFADRACLATAALAKAPVLTADQDWAKVDLGVKIVLIR